MKLLTKLKKAALFIMKQCKKILRTVFQPHFYNDKKSYNNGNLDLIFNISTIKIEPSILIKQFFGIKFINLF